MAADYYELLQIPATATFEEVHKAYRALAMQYHPDRNPAPGAAFTMVAINEAYSVLSEPSRRREYDRGRMAAPPFDIAGPILRAAYETLLKQGWIVAQSTERILILEQGPRAVWVCLTPRLNNAALKRIEHQFAGFSVVMAVEIETPINLSFHTAMIDLVHSSHHGAPFPDDCYRALFAPFVGA